MSQNIRRHVLDMRAMSNSLCEKNDTKKQNVPIITLFKMENPLEGAPSVAPSTPAWCPGGLQQTNALLLDPVKTRSME